jgi:3-phosphoshikimate 1-carboxyvinyltransferase
MLMKNVKVTAISSNIQGEITLSGSKSISNRVLLISALCDSSFEILNLSDSDDTVTMAKLINSQDEILHAHHAGTTFRFLTAYLATKPGTQTLTGSERMRQRPVKALVDALNDLGANIEYLENEGYPPIKINAPKDEWQNEITLPANISSQYISALLMIAPVLPEGLTIHLEGEIVSKPYIDMTLSIMRDFGIEAIWTENSIHIEHQKYKAVDYHIEADWSAASYYYIIAGLSDQCDITLKGLHQQSTQGDAAIVAVGEKFNIHTIFGQHQIKIVKSKDEGAIPLFEYDFLNTPDIAQSVAALCGGLGTSGLFSGLQTLRIKETDRIAALQNELLKINVFLTKMPTKFSQKTGIEYYMQEGKADNLDSIPSFDTYNDHRMAMSLAPLALKFPIVINEANVVSKSYPKYWEDLQKIGFEVTII